MFPGFLIAREIKSYIMPMLIGLILTASLFLI